MMGGHAAALKIDNSMLRASTIDRTEQKSALHQSPGSGSTQAPSQRSWLD
jgi:hypothetical protein